MIANGMSNKATKSSATTKPMSNGFKSKTAKATKAPEAMGWSEKNSKTTKLSKPSATKFHSASLTYAKTTTTTKTI